jgi:BON domain
MNRVHILLKRYHLLRDIVFGVAATIVSCGVAAAWHTNTHADDRQAIYRALSSQELTSVTVDQDQDQGVIRLRGIVDSTSLRDRAHQLAEHAAPGYTIDDQIEVNRAGLM